MENQLAPIEQGIALLQPEIEKQITVAFDRFNNHQFLPVKDAEQEVKALEVFAEIKTLNKSLKELQLSITRPIEAKADEVRARFKSAFTALDNAQHKAEQGILIYRAEVARKLEVQRQVQQAELDRIAKEEREKLQAEAQAEAIFGNAEKAQEIEIEAKSIEAPTVGIVAVKPKGERINYGWKVIDKTKVPMDYLTINEKMINAIVKSDGKNVSIPGVEVFPIAGLVLAKG